MIGEHAIKVLLVDDHPLILWGISTLLENETDIAVVGTARSAEQALEQIGALAPDVVVIDGTLPGVSGIVLVEQLQENWPSVIALALTLHEEGSYIREFLRAGARGFVLKQSAAEELIVAIRSVACGGLYLDPKIASKVVKLPTGNDHPETLSDREERVVRLIAEGFSNKEISRQLSLSVKTIETYRARACEKLGATSRSALVQHARREGWLS